nr:unnamed protein product [Digitaria exilis]
MGQRQGVSQGCHMSSSSPPGTFYSRARGSTARWIGASMVVGSPNLQFPTKKRWSLASMGCGGSCGVRKKDEREREEVADHRPEAARHRPEAASAVARWGPEEPTGASSAWDSPTVAYPSRGRPPSPRPALAGEVWET